MKLYLDVALRFYLTAHLTTWKRLTHLVKLVCTVHVVKGILHVCRYSVAFIEEVIILKKFIMVQLNYLFSIQLLLKKSARRNSRNNIGETPLHFAAKNGHVL